MSSYRSFDGAHAAEEVREHFVLHPLNSRYQDMEVKKDEFQIIGRVAEKKKGNEERGCAED